MEASALTMNDHDLLLRVDEKVSALHNRFDTFETDIKNGMLAHEKKDIETFVSKQEFLPVRLIAYGLVGLISVAVVGAILALVIHK